MLRFSSMMTSEKGTALDKLKSGESFLLYSLLLKKESLPIDYVYIGENGVFLIYTLNVKGTIEGTTTSLFWQTGNNRIKIIRIQNPFIKNSEHIPLVKNLLKNIDCEVYQVIVCPNKANMKNLEIEEENKFVIRKRALPCILALEKDKKGKINIYMRHRIYSSLLLLSKKKMA